MLAPIPYLDFAGYRRRTKVAPTDLDMCESLYAGYIDHRIARGSSLINGRLKKRYRVPLGQESPLLIAAGTAPPQIVLAGRPTLGSLELVIQITTPGASGTAVFQWSKDGGLTWTTGIGTISAGTVVLSGTGLVAAFPPATLSFSADNTYEASTPVPEIALGWLVALLDVDVWQRRGANPQDPSIAMAITERDDALAEIKEAADAKDGLFDLPTNDAAGDSAVTQGGPMFYSEQSPYVWMSQQRGIARGEDRACIGTSESADTP